jgi:tRNA-dihydrouridine synthase B
MTNVLNTVPALTIGTVRISPPVIQSPMSGWTDLPFRLIARAKGLKFAFLEMVLADAVAAGSAHTYKRMRSMPEDRPIGAQLVGYTPESIGAAAGILEEAGYDLIDLNLGCPVRKVTCKGGGSAVLKEPAKAESIFKRLVASVQSVPVTVKMRLGYDDPSGAEAVRIAQIAESCGVTAVTVHGRSRSQGYSGNADYEAIGRVKRAVTIPVIGNGDVNGRDSARRLLEVSGCDGVMIGRGGLGYPWVYREIASAFENMPSPPAPTFEEIKETLLAHLDLQVLHHPAEAPAVMRRVACSYFKNFPGVGEFRSSVNRAPSLDVVRSLIESFQPRSQQSALAASAAD